MPALSDPAADADCALHRRGGFFLGARRFLPTAGPPRSRDSGDGRDRGGEVAPDLSGRPVALSLDQPWVVVPPLELLEGLDQLSDGGEVMDPQPVLFEGPDEAFREAVGLRGRMHTIRTISLDVPV